MSPTVPFELFDRIEHPIFVTDRAGRLEYWNRAALALFASDASSLGERPCWEIARFRTPGGEALCGPDCPVHRWIRDSTLPDPILVLRRAPGECSFGMELLVFGISSRGPKRHAVLHLLKPSRSRRVRAATLASETIARRIDRLTQREREVLESLASGLTTMQIAEALFLSPATVRNHVRNLLAKLEVHHRIEAVLAWIVFGTSTNRE